MFPDDTEGYRQINRDDHQKRLIREVLNEKKPARQTVDQMIRETNENEASMKRAKAARLRNRLRIKATIS